MGRGSLTGCACCSEKDETFNKVGKAAVDNALQGYNSTVFAYGQVCVNVVSLLAHVRVLLGVCCVCAARRWGISV